MEQKVEKMIEKAKKSKKILAVVLFGSSLKGKGRDTDVCIFLNDKYLNLEMSKIRLDFLKDFNFDIQIFQQLPLYVRSRIIKEGKVLFCRDTNALYEIAFKQIKEFDLYEKAYNTYLEAIENG